MHTGPSGFHARRLKHFSLHVDAHARPHKGREANCQGARPTSDVNQTFVSFESLTARDFSKEARRIWLAISSVKWSGRIETSHKQPIGILAE
jgi:hypothetical protein